MAGLEELNYFLGKFISLWQTGRDARLHINSCDGQAHVNHQAGLEEAPPPLQRVPGPS